MEDLRGNIQLFFFLLAVAAAVPGCAVGIWMLVKTLESFHSATAKMRSIFSKTDLAI